ncbi:MAG TPA: HAMP domain-containing sensor histidine kinase [Solirubrobacteraceae bacterium]|nr:HAMP domain-containing sensor histidine kinase [Solirubrobacteraceae bacterium]
MPLGLRERFVAVLAMVSALTLAVAAIALFSPLDHLLRTDARDRLAQAVRGEVGDFTRLPAEAVRPGSPRLLAATRTLRSSGADVTVLDESGRVLVSTEPVTPGSLTAARQALSSGHERRIIAGSDAQPEVQVAIPVRIHGERAVVAARRSLADVDDVIDVVRRAFLVAAAAGLVGAVLVGLLIAGRMVRRLRRLRDTAERVAQVGPVAEFRPEQGRDEIGDLSRTFATMQTRLREQEQARRAFVATASHELRTPVASLQVMLDLLLSDLDADPVAIDDAREQARKADEQAARLSQLAGELLDLSRLDAGLALRSEPVELSEVLRSVVAEMDGRIAGEGRSLVVADGADGLALGDPGNVARIMRILLDNALRHTPAPGGVRVEYVAPGDLVGIAVEDDGPGVAAEDRERIFARFTRGAQAEPGGFGLGLAIGREMARRMGGDLALESTAAGARFVLTLPRAAPLQ